MTKVFMDAIDELLTRRVDKIYPSKKALKKVLRSGKKLKLYQGFDPSGIQLHIGHMTGLMKLRQFQELGHEVIFLIGDGTGEAGDPSGKTRTREKFLSNKELRENAKDYVMQAGKILKFTGHNPVKILYNGDWLNKLTLEDILEIAQHFSLQQLEERDLFVERKKKGEEINFREFLYPLLQGYDSVAMKVDLELGGSDQMFNMLCGRQLVKNYLNKEKFVMTTPLLTDSQGHKIGKTEGNVIALTAAPNDLYGMIMNLGDDVIVKCFEYLTNMPMEEIKNIAAKIAAGENPMVHKKKLAYLLTLMLNDKKSAQKAQEEFERVHQRGKNPQDISVVQVNPKEALDGYDLLIKGELASSRGEAKRLLAEGAITVDENIIKDLQFFKISNGTIIQRGKRKFIKINYGS